MLVFNDPPHVHMAARGIADLRESPGLYKAMLLMSTDTYLMFQGLASSRYGSLT